MTHNVRVRGKDELIRQLETLPLRIETYVLRGAVRAGANVFKKEAKRLAPTGSGPKMFRGEPRKHGDLKRSIRVFVKRPIKSGYVIAHVKAGDYYGFYAHMVEGGTKPHPIYPKKKRHDGLPIKKAIAFNGKVYANAKNNPGAKPRPFMKAAFHNSCDGAIDAVSEYISNRLPRELAKYVKAG